MTFTLEDLKRIRGAGLSLLPVQTEDKKPWAALLPGGKWESLQNELPSDEYLERWAKAGLESVAVICGRISGGLLVIDCDSVAFYQTWMRRVHGLVKACPIQKTGSGKGYQVFMRCDAPGRNQKLAMFPDSTKKKGLGVGLETRGEAGYVLIPPSLHPSGGRYEWLRQGFDSIPYLPQQVVEDILEIARSFDESPPPPPVVRRVREYSVHTSSTSVIEAYNERTDIGDLLESFGYARMGKKYCAPSSESGIPGVTIMDNNECYSWHSTDPLADKHAHSAFSVLCLLGHGDDVKKAVFAAARELNMDPPVQHEVEPFAAIGEVPADPDKFFESCQPFFDAKAGLPGVEVLYEDLEAAYLSRDVNRMKEVINQLSDL